MDAVTRVLGEIGASQIPTILAFNKRDLVSDADAEVLAARHPGAVFISAARGDGLHDLLGLDIVATAASYGVRAHEAHDSEEVVELFRSGIEDHDRPTLINVPITRVSPLPNAAAMTPAGVTG